MLLPRLKRFLQSRQERMPEGEVLLDADLFRSFLYDGMEDIDEALSYFSDVSVAVADLNLAEGDKENLQGDIQPSLALVLLFLRDVETAENDFSYQRKIVVSERVQRGSSAGGQQYRSAANIRRITDNISATVMLSGTFRRWRHTSSTVWRGRQGAKAEPAQSIPQREPPSSGGKKGNNSAGDQEDADKGKRYQDT